jgi:hypothetical protein
MRSSAAQVKLYVLDAAKRFGTEARSIQKIEGNQVVKNRKENTLTTTQPADWIEAMRKAAKQSSLTLSEWIGKACIKEAKRQGVDCTGLTERRKKGRPTK